MGVAVYFFSESVLVHSTSSCGDFARPVAFVARLAGKGVAVFARGAQGMRMEGGGQHTMGS